MSKQYHNLEKMADFDWKSLLPAAGGAAAGAGLGWLANIITGRPGASWLFPLLGAISGGGLAHYNKDAILKLFGGDNAAAASTAVASAPKAVAPSQGADPKIVYKERRIYPEYRTEYKFMDSPATRNVTRAGGAVLGATGANTLAKVLAKGKYSNSKLLKALSLASGALGGGLGADKLYDATLPEIPAPKKTPFDNLLNKVRYNADTLVDMANNGLEAGYRAGNRAVSDSLDAVGLYGEDKKHLQDALTGIMRAIGNTASRRMSNTISDNIPDVR